MLIPHGRNREKIEKTRENRKESQRIKLNGSYNWLISLPLKDHIYILNKQQFWDAICITFN